MLLKKRAIFLSVFFILIILGFAYAQTYQVSYVKDVLKRNLYLHFTNPGSSYLSVNELKDLLIFYLTIPGAQTTVDASGVIGDYSNKPIPDILGEGDSAPDTIPVCSDGTKYGECSALKPKYCYKGSLINKCGVCGCGIGYNCLGDGTCQLSQNITCYTGNDCGINGTDVGNPYCLSNWVTINKTYYSCVNSGTPSSWCDEEKTPYQIEYCDPENSECVEVDDGEGVDVSCQFY